MRTGRPRSQVALTTPVSSRPAYGVTGFLWCSRAGSTVNVSSGATTQKSASRPGSMAPFRSSPAIAAGRSAIHRASRSRPKPRCRACDQTAGSPSCSEAIPPHAAPKSPSSSRFRSGVQGEWSDTTQSIVPSASPDHSSSRLAASRIGGQHLNWVAPSGTPPR